MNSDPKTSGMSDILDGVRPFWPDARDFGPLPANYQSWTAARKQNFLWTNRILPSQYESLPPLQPIDWAELLRTALRQKMHRRADEVPPSWNKTVHAHGSVVKIRFVSAFNTPFTGLFQEADHGLLRLSLAGNPKVRGVAPGLAIKLFVDGTHSENTSALVSFSGQGKNYNVMANEYSTAVPIVRQMGPIFFHLMLMRASRFPNRLSLKSWAMVNQYGEPVTRAHAPNQIFLVPNPSIRFVARAPHDFRKDLVKIPSDTRLFSVYAVDPTRVNESKTHPDKIRRLASCIGYIDTTSEFVSSFYGDRYLFFRHQRFRWR